MRSNSGVTRTFSAAGASAVVSAGGGAAFAAWLASRLVEHAGAPTYDLPGIGVGIGLAAALASLLGRALGAWRRDGIVLGAAFVGLLLVAGVLSLFSIGLPLLLLCLVLLVVLLRAGASRDGHAPVAVSLAVAALVGIGLPVLALVAADGPVVKCEANGVSSSSGFVRGLGGDGTDSGSAISTVAPSGKTTTAGMVTTNGRLYRYKCNGEKLVEFQVDARPRDTHDNPAQPSEIRLGSVVTK